MPNHDVNITAVIKAEYISGDTNSDGRVNTSDAVSILRYSADMITLSSKQLTAADVDQNRKANTGDAVILLRFVAGLIPEL